jgi:hypothetical protein
MCTFFITVATRLYMHFSICALQTYVHDLRAREFWQEISCWHQNLMAHQSCEGTNARHCKTLIFCLRMYISQHCLTTVDYADRAMYGRLSFRSKLIAQPICIMQTHLHHASTFASRKNICIARTILHKANIFA